MLQGSGGARASKAHGKGGGMEREGRGSGLVLRGSPVNEIATQAEFQESGNEEEGARAGQTQGRVLHSQK